MPATVSDHFLFGDLPEKEVVFFFAATLLLTPQTLRMLHLILQSKFVSMQELVELLIISVSIL